MRGGASLCIVILLAACDNFLNAKETRAEIEKAIDYANASTHLIKVEADKDSGIITKPAAGEAKVKVTDTFNLSFNSEQDYQFIKWEVYNETTNQPIENGLYLQIEDPSKIDTSCTVLNYPENSNIIPAVRAIAAERPQISLARPQHSETGAPRVSNIEISFNKSNMDPGCIYYSEDEMSELKQQLGLSDSDFLKGDETLCNNQYYGYIDQEGHKHFKNIQFSGVQLNSYGEYDPVFPGDYFCDPYFTEDAGFPGCRLIYQSTNPPIEINTTVYYTLNKEFCYIQNGVPVKMRESKPYAYLTMPLEDEKPVFHRDVLQYIQVKVGNAWKPLATFLRLGNSMLDNSSPIPESSDTQNIEFRFQFEAQDKGGSGLRPTFQLCLIDSSNITYKTYEIPYSSIKMNGSKGTPPNSYIIKRGTELQNAGEYKFKIIILDNDNNQRQAHSGDIDHPDDVYYKLKLKNAATTN